MIPAILTLLSAHAQEAPLRFQPKLGEKYRFLATIEMEKGKSALPPDMSLAIIYKVAGVKNGLYTVHQLEELSVGGKPGDPMLKGTHQIDELMKSTMIAAPGTGESGGATMAISSAIGSIFLINFSKEFPTVGNEVVDKLDLTKFATSMFSTIPPDQLFLHSELDGTRKTTLQKFDSTTATFGSSIAIKVKITPPEESGAESGGIFVDGTGTVVIERATGMPIEYTIKMVLTVQVGDNKNVINANLHLLRKI